MTKRITNIFYIVLASLLFFSCKKDLPTLDVSNAKVKAPSTSAKIDWNGIANDDKTTVFMDYQISPVNVGVNPPLKYMIEIDTSATFGKPALLVTFFNIAKDTNLPILVADVNNLLKAKFNATIGDSYKVYMRTRVNILNINNIIIDSVFSSANNYNVGPVYGEVLMFDYFNIPNGKMPRTWWLVGGMTTDGWGNSATKLGSGLWPLSVVNGLVYNADGDGQFTGTFYLNAGVSFKIIRDPGAWDPAWGTSGGAMNMSYRAPGASEVSNITPPTSGWYKIELNSIANTCTITTTAVPTTSYTSMYLVGGDPSLGWDENTGGQALIATTTTNNHLWYKAITLTTTDNTKFRAGVLWTNDNWGGQFFPIGLGSGGDLSVPAGSYIVIMNDIDRFSYFIKQ